MTITIRHPGAQTTVQDRGRPGWQHAGVPVGGPLDACAHRVANLLVGNVATAAALETALGGLTVQFRQTTLVALTGREIVASLDGAPVTAWRPLLAPANSVLALHAGVRTSIAVAGGISAPSVLGSRSTALRGAFGGLDGRCLRTDDVLTCDPPTALGQRITEHLQMSSARVAHFGAGPGVRPPYTAEPTLRCIAGPELDALTETSRAALLRDAFALTPEMDRMGCRLRGPTLALRSALELVSTGVTAGTMQLPPGGDPIILLADRQTTGGYPRLADVITADLPLLAQLRPGERVRFALVSLDAAHNAGVERERDLGTLAAALQLRFPSDAA
jgi:antagonist of KipI